MALQYVTAEEKDFSAGIDARSSENQISPRFVKELLNGDVIEKRIRKRVGYQGYAGNLPVRVTSVEYRNTDNQICFNLDTAVTLNDAVVDLSAVQSSPIIVYGRSSSIASGGPFTTSGDAVRYYSAFSVPTKKVLGTGAGTLSISGEEHGIQTTNILVGFAESTSFTNRSHSFLLNPSTEIDESSFGIDIDYTNSTGASKNVYVYYRDQTDVAGSSYTGTLAHGGAGSQTFTVTAATHGLSNFNIVAQLQVDNGSSREISRPESLTIQSNGDVVAVVNYTGAATNFYLTLSTTEPGNQASGNIASSSTDTVIVSGITSPWVFPSIYQELTAGGDLQLIIPDSVEYDDETQQLTFTIVNSTTSPLSLKAFYNYGVIRSNQICVDDATITTDATDTRPQLTIWGLDHSEIYGPSPALRAGWSNHIDSYRSTGEQRMLAGLGGNLFSSQTYDEAGETYLFPLLYPRLRARTGSSRILGPLFWNTGETPARTRGYITSTDSGTHWVTVTAVQYDSGTGWTKYTLSVPSKQILDSSGSSTTLSSVISTTTDLQDWLTAQNMSFGRHNGTFRIRQVQDGTNQIFVWVENDDNSADYDDSGTSGQAGIFTDQMVFTATAPFVPGDLLENSAVGDLVCTCLSSSGTSAVIDGVLELLEVSGGLVTTATRTSSIVPLRDSLPGAADSVENLVRGDMLSYTDTSDSRLLRVLSINADSDRTVNITSDGQTATVTLASGDTSFLAEGSKVLLAQAGPYSGTQTISTILSTTTFEFETSETDSASGATLVGKTAELDEELTWLDTIGDTSYFQVGSRWIPIEAPTDNYSPTPSTYIRHFDADEYGNQSFLRSTGVVSNLYLTNYQDEVYKFDGTNTYRAGLFPWQPGLFVTFDSAPASRIVTGVRTIAYSAISASLGQLTITSADTDSIPIGASVRLSGSSQTYTVRNYTDDGTTYFLLVDRSLDSSVSSTGNVSEMFVRRYYFRLNAVDANDNIIASAVTGYQDHVVELPFDAVVYLKLVGMPVWDAYDYDRLEVEIYATVSGTPAPFYRLDTIQMDFDNTQGYITYTDSFTDSDLVQRYTDVVSGALKGRELGVGWQEPLRSKYITSIGNRLVQGNIRDYPQLDVQIQADASVSNSTYAGKIWTFRKDSTDSGSTTNMVDRVRYELVNGTTGNVTSVSIGTDAFTVNVSGSTAAIAATGDWIYLTYSSTTSQSISKTFVDGDVNTGTETITVVGHGLIDGQQVRFSNTGGTLPGGLSSSVTYYIVGAAANTFQVALTLGGAAVNITSAAGGGTHSVILQGNNLTYSGWWQIQSKTASSVTINLAGAAAVVTYPDRYVIATDPTDVPVLLGTDGNLGMVNGDTFDTFDVMRRFSMAINASMRMVDISLTGMLSFTAWMTARGGNDVGRAGRLVVRQPRVDSTSLELQLPSSFSSGGVSFAVFVNDIRRSTSAQVSAITRVYPSRITVSYENYPEILDNPTAILDSESESAIDINSADGQEITGVIPFFGEAAFGAAQQSAILVVFKTNSIYLVDINQKIAGENPVQRIETEGLGCTAPYSIASTKKGIVFANESGIYCLRRDQSIQYLGRYMERKWTSTVNRDQLELCQGHHYGVGRCYKLSVPLVDETANSEVFVYNHTGEDYSESQLGAWSRYDSHNATGWANLGSDAFWSSTTGRVFSIRRQGTETDFRDDSTAISFQLDTRALDFGNSGIRKVMDSIVADYRVPSESTGTSLSYAVDTAREFRTSTPFTIASEMDVSGIDDQIGQDIVTISHDTDRRKGTYFQIRVENSSIDEGVEVAGMSFRVGGLSDRGEKQARQTRED